MINSTGSTPNNYLFAGEQYDPVLGLYYNRARYLSTASGRFWSMDTFEGRTHDPLSLHKYLYADANPVDRTDQNGHEGLAELSLSVAIQTSLGALAGIAVSTVLFGIGTYNALTRLPKDAFSKPADATLVGFQVSRSISDFVPESSPFLEGLAFGLSFTAGTGGVEALFPKFTNTAWFYAYIGSLTAVKIPSGGPAQAGLSPSVNPNADAYALPEFYVGKVWNLTDPKSYEGPFYCVSGQLAAARFQECPAARASRCVLPRKMMARPGHTP
ncbi:MAG TPA: RHS repeat-associated core domain-containing protein [Candidatus Sulfotelmatobacter sp.]|nr:RHS repeat-associated core domain-containing protein [Candidatus Sulfotelmatobacter sp.]